MNEMQRYGVKLSVLRSNRTIAITVGLLSLSLEAIVSKEAEFRKMQEKSKKGHALLEGGLQIRNHETSGFSKG